MSLSVTVTGATGFVGNNLVRQLIECGHQVNVIVRPDRDNQSLEGLDINIVVGQLDDSKLLGDTFQKSDVIVHAAALIWIGRKRLDESRRINVEFTRHIAKRARENKVRMILVSTVDTLRASRSSKQVFDETDWFPPKSKTAYTISKREAEEAMRAEIDLGLDGVIVNPSFMIGPWDWKPSSGLVILGIARNWVPMAPGGGLSVADVRDVCRGIISAIEDGRTGERYILAGQNMPYLKLWKLIAARVGKTWPRLPLPGLFARAVGRYSDLVGFFKGKEGISNFAAMMVAQKYSYYSSKKAEEELGYSISPVETAIDDAVAWLTEHDYL